MERELSSQELTPLQRFDQVFDLLNWMAEPIREEDYWKVITGVGVFVYNPHDSNYSPSIFCEPLKAYTAKKLLNRESPFYRKELFNKAMAGLAQIETVAVELVRDITEPT